LEEVSIIKSVPNLISYLHKIFWNFYQFLAICSKLFSSGGKFNSEIADMRGPPVSHRFPRWACLSVPRRRMAATRPRRAASCTRPHRAIKALTDSVIPTAPLRCPSRAVASPHARPSRPHHLPCQSRAATALGSEPPSCPSERAATIFR
jgi:hypothetical protein